MDGIEDYSYTKDSKEIKDSQYKVELEVANQIRRITSQAIHKAPSQVTYKEQRQFLEKLQKERKINVAISQLRFFTLYVLHKPWDDTQLSYFLHRMIFSQFSGNPISLSNCSRVRCGHCLRTLLMSLVKPDLNALKSSSLIR